MKRASSPRASAIRFWSRRRAAAAGAACASRENAGSLAEAFAAASAEARAAFGNPQVYLERYLGKPRHIEVQILADGQGGVVHLGERDCSLQRKHQKLLEETPSPALNAGRARRRDQARDRCDGEARLSAAPARSNSFIRTAQFFFIEMNTRLQVEHPISEMVSGVDIVREQLRDRGRACRCR